MKKRLFALLALFTFTISACGGANEEPERKVIDFDSLESNEFQTETNTSGLGAFKLLSPFNGAVLDSAPESYSWNPSSNAETYTLEICSSDTFISYVDTVDYYSVSNLTETTYSINASLTGRDHWYYWRVFAVNHAGEIECTSTFSFYLKAPEVKEFNFDLGEADDWQLHSAGSYADIAMDNSNFFGNDESSLVIQFKKEDTNRGVPSSDGWIIVTRTIEKSIFGTDSLFFNLFYAGQDSTVQIRLVDKDNEYWYCYVKVSNNAKQSVILKFDDFVQRTGDVTVANNNFDYERIKYFEVVFERTFGDGVLLLSGVKAIRFQDYRNLFIEKLNFKSFKDEDWEDDNYEFKREIDGTELTLNHFGEAGNGHKKINGYGFSKLVVNRYFYSSDAIKVSVKCTGTKGTNALIRIYEEDTDRWFYRIPYSVLSDEYIDLLIPIAAFGSSSLMGDGKRQFYFIINIQFGMEGQYGTGSLSFKDFELVKMSDYIEDKTRVIGEDGLVEDFDNYTTTSEIYYQWQTSTVNKDEYMVLNNTNKTGGEANPFCGQFEYKSDMAPAEYGMQVKIEDDFSAISMWLKDNSVKTGDKRLSHVKNISPDVIITIYMSSGEKYVYTIESLPRNWNNYVIPFNNFELAEKVEGLVNPIKPTKIAGFSISLQYYYYDFQGKALPVYSMNNPVYIDTIKFTKDTGAVRKEILERIISLEDDVALVDSFEDYDTNDRMMEFWTYGTTAEYRGMELSNEASSKGGKHSIKMQYETNSDSPAYYTDTTLDENVSCRGMKFSLKGDGNATVYINLYLTFNNTELKFRYTATKVPAEWTEYSIGFANFGIITGTTGTTITNKNIIYLSKISIGMAYSGASTKTLSYIYLDNIALDATLDYSTEVIEKIPVEAE